MILTQPETPWQSAPWLNSLVSGRPSPCSYAAWYSIATSFINLDVSWLLYAAGRVADGEILYVDIYETNPPIAVYFNLPALKLAVVSGFEPTVAFHLYLVSIMFLSIGLTWYFITLV